MSNVRAASRYAAALLGVSDERGEMETVGRDISFLEELITKVPDFALFLKSPVVSKERKRQALTQIIGGKTGETVGTFVLLLASKRREALLPDIISEFHRLRDVKTGVLNASAKSAAPFSPGQEKNLTGQLEKATGKRVRLKVSRDPALVGGFTVQYEDTVWDASVKRQLELLGETLAG
jgi:F-type H+-transporting ATPase subunit delta